MEIFKDRLKTCYWCNKIASSHEHVPPQNLFPKGYRKDLITVGACKEHNQSFSKLDERLRYHMVLLGDENLAKQVYETAILRGFRREESLKLKIDLANKQYLNLDGKRWQRESSISYDLYFEKIIRGLYFFHFGRLVYGSTSFFSFKMALLNLTVEVHNYYYQLEESIGKNWIQGKSINKDVFDYKYYYSASKDQFFLFMKFYKEHDVIGVTIPVGKNINDFGLPSD